ARIQSTPAETVAALEAMLDPANPVEVRRAAAAALAAVLRGTQASDRGGFSAPVVEPPRTNLVGFGPLVARAAGAHLTDRDAEVRRLCSAALRQVATTLNTQLRAAEAIGDLHKQLRGVVTALWDQAPALAA